MSKSRQQTNEHVEFFIGFKVHIIIELEYEVSLTVSIEPRNIYDKKLFQKLFRLTRDTFGFKYGAKYIDDSAFDSTEIKEELRGNLIIPVIARNCRRVRTPEISKDCNYRKRWAIERIFSRLKGVFGLSKIDLLE
ncbi:MAG: transposase [Candidatus Micrarchaeia archaeon]